MLYSFYPGPLVITYRPIKFLLDLQSPLLMLFLRSPTPVEEKEISLRSLLQAAFEMNPVASYLSYSLLDDEHLGISPHLLNQPIDP